jgi:uncharacterized protein
MSADRENKLIDIIKSLDSVVVGLSGGVDSTLITRLCLDNLGQENVWIATGDSESIPSDELEACRNLIVWLEVPEDHYRIIKTSELSDPNYTVNNELRCYHCKRELFARLREYARQVGARHIIDGANASDLSDYRPGIRAGRELNVRSPFIEAGFAKDDVRALAKKLKLPNWDKPAMPCLASRIPYFSPVTAVKLEQIDRAEKYLKSLGFKQFRVRHHGKIARLELDDFARLFENGVKDKIYKELKNIGFAYVTVDLEGYRSGSLNIDLDRREKNK